MANIKEKIRSIVAEKDLNGIIQMLRDGLDPNFENGWALRLAAREGSSTIARLLVKFGANPHLSDKSGASTLQLAVYSGRDWETEGWQFLLSYCNSSQLADGAAVAIVFRKLHALRLLLRTGRCNVHLPTTLTGRTVESLARSYNVAHFLTEPRAAPPPPPPPSPLLRATAAASPQCISPARLLQLASTSGEGAANRPPAVGTLSPSVAHFFEQTAAQANLTPQRVVSARPVPFVFLTSPTIFQ